MAMRVQGGKMVPAMQVADKQKFQRVINAASKAAEEMRTASLLSKNISGNNENGWTQRANDLVSRIDLFISAMQRLNNQ